MADVYRPRPVSAEPEAVLIQWQVIEVSGPGLDKTRHFYGFNLVTADGRISSPIQTWDPDTQSGTTRSGRRYLLQGPPGTNLDAEHVLGRWLRMNKITETTIVSGEYYTPSWGDQDERDKPWPTIPPSSTE